jgi:hypothetical protein
MIRTKKERNEGIEDLAESTKRYASSPLTCTRRESGLLSSSIIYGLAIAHLSVFYTLRRREKHHCPSQLISIIQRCVIQMNH